jgi:hypothetical protein
MLAFLAEEGILTFGTMTGLFTASLLNSLKVNIIEPICENIIETKHLDKHAKSDFGIDVSQISLQSSNPGLHIKWQTFVRDFATWFIIILILYLIWNFYFKPYKNKIF